MIIGRLLLMTKSEDSVTLLLMTKSDDSMTL